MVTAVVIDYLPFRYELLTRPRSLAITSLSEILFAASYSSNTMTHPEFVSASYTQGGYFLVWDPM